MGVTALVMAGGKGKRLALQEEKPLIRIGGKPIIEYIIAALRAAKKVDSIVVAVSDYTPKTAEYLRSFPVSVIKTPGKEYVSDMQYAIKTLNLQVVLAIGADLPLINGKVIDEVVDCYEHCGKPALSVVVPFETKKSLGFSCEYAFSFGDMCVVPAGINIIDGRRVDDGELDQEICLLNRKEVAVNVNTLEELKIAERLLAVASEKK
ncbi:MAG: NTP transferase domain-containing protein [Candidatus Bathyarchaeota archaeon]|nr:NTP transferase domain-containing protein [Candidatus Bathyarchaeota archaeon]